MAQIDDARERFEKKRAAYENTFAARVEFDIGRWALLKLCLRCLVSKRQAYRLTFNGAGAQPHPPGQEVIADLRRLAGIDSGGLVYSPGTGAVDPNATCYRAGLRDMYLRIVKFVGIDESEL